MSNTQRQIPDIGTGIAGEKMRDLMQRIFYF
jgi:hypothetical protein